ncbi:MAG: DUF5681 domain-containing protein [Endomicrobia bacterium]|nr:DUF5681 domain-containing protein [Endomicrobiia bacterium]
MKSKTNLISRKKRNTKKEVKQNDDDVGYGKPPKHGQFKKGFSGNPFGRPKCDKNTDTIFKKIVEEEIPGTKNGRPVKTQILTAIIVKLVNKALGGDFKSIAKVINMSEKIGLKDAEKAKMLSAVREEDKLILKNLIERSK